MTADVEWENVQQTSFDGLSRAYNGLQWNAVIWRMEIVRGLGFGNPRGFGIRSPGMFGGWCCLNYRGIGWVVRAQFYHFQKQMECVHCTHIVILLTFDIDCPWWQLMPSGKLPHSLWWPSGEKKPPVSQIGGEMIIWRFSPLLIERSTDRDNLALSVASSLQTGELRSSLPAAAGKRECQEFYVKFCRMHLMIGGEEKLYH